MLAFPAATAPVMCTTAQAWHMRPSTVVRLVFRFVCLSAVVRTLCPCFLRVFLRCVFARGAQCDAGAGIRQCTAYDDERQSPAFCARTRVPPSLAFYTPHSPPQSPPRHNHTGCENGGQDGAVLV